MPAASCLPALPELGLPVEVVVLLAGGGGSGWAAALLRNAWHMPRSGGSSALVLLATGKMLPSSARASAGARGFSVFPACAGDRGGR